MVTRWAFATLPLIELVAYVDSGNRASARVPEKAGWRCNGPVETERGSAIAYSTFREHPDTLERDRVRAAAGPPDMGEGESSRGLPRQLPGTPSHET